MPIFFYTSISLGKLFVGGMMVGILKVYFSTTVSLCNLSVRMLRLLIRLYLIFFIHQILNIRSTDVTVVKSLTSFITKYHHLMRRSDLSRFLRHVQGLGRGLDVGDIRRLDLLHLTNSLESSLRSVLSLSQLSRISIRSSLGGNIFSASHQLPLPNRLKEYIHSGE